MFDKAYFDQIQFDGKRGESVTVTPSPASAIGQVVAPTVIIPSGSIDKEVGGSWDDGYTKYWSVCASGQFEYATLSIACGKYSYNFNAWLRFTGVVIPQGATITAAYIKIYTCTYPGSGTTDTKIYADDQANPVSPGDAADHCGRTRTTQGVAWNQEFIANQWHQSPNIAAVIQELVDSYDFSSGAAIQILWDNKATSGIKYVDFNSYDEPLKPPQLHIEYTLAGVTVSPSPASAVGSVVAPTVVGGSVVVTPSPASAIAQVVQPTVKHGNIIFSPTPVDAVCQVVAPTTIVGGLTLTPSFVATISSVVAPTVVLGSTTATPEYVKAICQVAGPTVAAGGDVVVSPDAVSAIGGVVAPTIVLGSITITPTEISAVAQVVAPNVIHGNIIFRPEYVKAVCQVVVPTVIGGAVIITPVYVEAITQGVNPGVVQGSITMTPAFIKALTGVIAPSVLETWIGRKLRIKIVTSQYRNLDIFTSQKRRVDVVTTQKRKIKTLTSGS